MPLWITVVYSTSIFTGPQPHCISAKNASVSPEGRGIRVRVTMQWRHGYSSFGSYQSDWALMMLSQLRGIRSMHSKEESRFHMSLHRTRSSSKGMKWEAEKEVRGKTHIPGPLCSNSFAVSHRIPPRPWGWPPWAHTPGSLQSPAATPCLLSNWPWIPVTVVSAASEPTVFLAGSELTLPVPDSLVLSTPTA